MTVPHPSVPGVTFKDFGIAPGYCVGDDGSAWSRVNHAGRLTDKWRLLTPDIDQKNGYLRVRIGGKRGKRYLLHRLVLEAFVGPCPPGHEGSHYPDRDRANCRLDNLRWELRSANHLRKREHGTIVRGTRHHNAVLNPEKVRQARRLASGGLTQKAIAQTFGVSKATIQSVLAGETWGHVI